MIDVHAVNKKSKESTQILMCTLYKKKKKVHRFLQNERKKMINVHAINKKSKESTQIYNMEEKK